MRLPGDGVVVGQADVLPAGGFFRQKFLDDLLPAPIQKAGVVRRNLPGRQLPLRPAPLGQGREGQETQYHNAQNKARNPPPDHAALNSFRKSAKRPDDITALYTLFGKKEEPKRPWKKKVDK